VVLAWLFFEVLIGQSGCAMYRRDIAPPSEQVRRQLRSVSVVSAAVAPKAALEGPTSGKGSGAAKGAGLSLR
jgi:hypothetical protein